MGYDAYVDDDGDIGFTYRGFIHFIIFTNDEPDLFTLYCGGFCEIQSEDLLVKALHAVDVINATVKGVKMFLSASNTYVAAAIDMIGQKPETIEPVFPRLLERIAYAMDKFGRIMQSEGPQGVNGATVPDVIDEFFVKYVSYYTYGQRPTHLGEVTGTVTRTMLHFQEDERTRRGTTLQFPIISVASVVARGVVTRLVKVQLADGSAIDISCKTAEGQERIKAAISAAMRQM